MWAGMVPNEVGEWRWLAGDGGNLGFCLTLAEFTSCFSDPK